MTIQHHHLAAGLSSAALALGAVVAATTPASADTVTSTDGLVSVEGPTTLAAGTAGTYTVTFTNNTGEGTTGPAGIAFDVTTPAGMTLQHSSGCSSLGGGRNQPNFICLAPNLAAGASSTATFTEVGNTPGSSLLQFSVDAATPSLGSFGDSAGLEVTTLPGPTDVQVTGSSDNGAPKVGNTFAYTFQVKDNGPQGAAGVTFSDTLPAGLVLAGAATATTGSCVADPTAGTVDCSIGSLAVGQQSAITIPTTALTTGTFADTGAITVAGTDDQPANNSVTVTIQPRLS